MKFSKKQPLPKQNTNLKDNAQSKGFSNIGFILSALGAAVGLGNIWKFPYLVANYGGSFFIAFFAGLIFIGVPILILEINIGKKMRSSSALAYKSLNKKTEFYGWFQTFIAGTVAIYYAVVVGWALIGLFESFIPHFFENNQHPIVDFMSNTSSIHSINWKWIVGLLAGWAIIMGIVMLGVKKGIEKTNLFLLPALFIMLIGIAIYAATLHGAAIGLNYLFRIDTSDFTKIAMWKSAFGQDFFSLCIASGAIITYSKYSKYNHDVNNVAWTIAFGNTLVSIISSILVFSVIGYEFQQSGSSLTFKDWFSNNHLLSGPPLIFATCPKIFGILMMQIGYGGNIIALIFFLTIVFASVTSIISMGMTVVDNIKEKFARFNEKIGMVFFAIISLILGFVMTTNIGPGVIDSTDFWVSSNIMILSGIVECILMTYFFRKIKYFKEFGNSRSAYKVSILWEVCIGVIAPVVLAVILIWTWIKGTFSTHIASLSSGTIAGFLGVAIAVIIISVMLGVFLLEKKPQLGKGKISFLTFIFIPVIALIVVCWRFLGIRVIYDGNPDIVQYFAIAIVGISSILFPIILTLMTPKTKIAKVNKKSVKKNIQEPIELEI